MITIAVMMTCYNRRETTLACLHRLYAQELPANVNFQVYLVDDGCSDGTGEAVKLAHSDIKVIQGDGTLFWCNGMRLAWEYASTDDPDFYLWLNDDAMLLDGALNKLLVTYAEVSGQRTEFSVSFKRDLLTSELSIIVGSCRDPLSGLLSYGGQKQTGRHPGKFRSIPPLEHPVWCDTFQGNVVLIPRGVYKRIGSMRPFHHTMGDTDYGLRALAAGCAVVLAPGFVADCEKNNNENISLLPRRKRLTVVFKRIPPLDWWRFLFLHAKWRAPFYWPLVYIRAVFINPLTD